MQRRWLVCVLVASAVLFLPAVSGAGSVTLAFDFPLATYPGASFTAKFVRTAQGQTVTITQLLTLLSSAACNALTDPQRTADTLCTTACLNPGQYSISVFASAPTYANSADSAALNVDFTALSACSGTLGWWHFDEGTGLASADSSGNGRHAALQNGVSWSAGKVGPFAVTCDGVDDELIVYGLLGAPPVLTAMLWMNTGAITAGGSELLSLGDYVGLRLTPTTIEGNVRSAGAWTQVSAPLVLAGTGWHHVALVVNPPAVTTQLYVDGSLQASAALGSPVEWSAALGPDTHVCRHGNGGTRYLQGTVDEAKVIGRALTASEIAAEYGALPQPRHRVLITR